MTRAYEVYDGDAVVTYDESPQSLMKIMDKITNYLSRHNITSSTDLHNSEDAIVESPELLSDIIDDVLKGVYWRYGTKEE